MKRALGISANTKVYFACGLDGDRRLRWLGVVGLSLAAAFLDLSGPRVVAAIPIDVQALGGGISKLSFPPPPEMTRADVYASVIESNPVGVLVLCPGFNENGESLIHQPAWRGFARANRLGLCAISFASPGEVTLSSRGYYAASHGSGDVLFSGINRSFGRELPIFIYGFSGGAHFTASLINWNPKRVLGWCAYSAAWWEDPATRPDAAPPGIVACGDEDATVCDLYV